MNKQRRKELADVMDELSKFAAALVLVPNLAEILEKLESLKDEEQDYYDNMPEGLQNGDKGAAAQQAVSDMENAISALEPLRDALDEFNNEDILSHIDDARGEA
jgi:hypothetical protein